ncbi:hypothetical protein JCM11251_007232 [Rhodosporidiobolus azoricus]
MAALNWAMLTRAGIPIPLPQEKLLLTTPSISLLLFPLPPGAPLNAQPRTKWEEWTAKGGTLYTSTMRVVFVAPGAGQRGESDAVGGTGRSLADGSASIAPGGVPESSVKEEKAPLQTLSVPLSKLVDGRLVQPWFTATYYEAMVLPGEGGGLSEPHLVRFYFKESGGFDFQQTVSEMRDRLELSSRRGRSEMEDLPVYTPASPAAAAPSSSSTILSPSPSRPGPSSSLARAPLAAPQFSPTPSTLDAARVAREAEAAEAAEEERAREEDEERDGRRKPPPEPREGEAPPGYEV